MKGTTLILILQFIILHSTMAQNTSSQLTFLKEILLQNQVTCGFALNQVNQDNLNWKLNDSVASIGFMYRHIGETINLFGSFLEKPSTVQNSTMGQSDSGQGHDFYQSKELITKGFAMMHELIEEKKDEWWMEEIDTPFFGPVSKVRLFSHILFHNAHHAGQISLTISRAMNKP